MATDKKISELTSNPTINGSEEIAEERGGSNYKNTLQDVKTWVLDGVVSGGIVDSVNGKSEADVVIDGTDIELVDGGIVTVTEAISDLSTEVTNLETNKQNKLTTEIKTSDFAPLNEGEKLFICDSATSITVTINLDACALLETIYFYQKGAGKVLIIDGTGTTVASLYSSFKTSGQYAEIAIQQVETGVFVMLGQTE